MVPDTGSVRGDVLALMRRVNRRFLQMGHDLVSGILAESGERIVDDIFLPLLRP